MTNRKNPTAGFWITVALVAVVVYVASFGLACWVTSRTAIGARAVSIGYRPLMFAWEADPKFVGAFLSWYAEVGAEKEWTWTQANTWRKLSPF